MSTERSEVSHVIESVFAAESRRIFASLVRRFGDFDLAEEALQDAFRAALEQWPHEGVPRNPVAWLITTGRFKAIDEIRRRSRLEAIDPTIADRLLPDPDLSPVEDERLRLIFTCCHPAISPDAQVALTLREVCGLTTEEIAHAFFTPVPTMAQRIVRAKSKIRDAKIPFELPSAEELPERLGSVLRVAYLVFNEGYSATYGDLLIRTDLASEAIRLMRLIAELQPDPETTGLLALMLCHEARRPARIDVDGNLVSIEKQDRSLWDRFLIEEGAALVLSALGSRRIGAYALQAAISAVHNDAAAYEATDWNEIVGLYGALLRIEPTPIVELNLAVAISMRDGPDAGLARVEAILARGDLTGYHLAHAARADCLERMGAIPEARDAYETARNLTQQEPERRFLQEKLTKLEASHAVMSNL